MSAPTTALMFALRGFSFISENIANCYVCKDHQDSAQTTHVGAFQSSPFEHRTRSPGEDALEAHGKTAEKHGGPDRDRDALDQRRQQADLRECHARTLTEPGTRVAR
jgi:hypothetical protein